MNFLGISYFNIAVRYTSSYRSNRIYLIIGVACIQLHFNAATTAQDCWNKTNANSSRTFYICPFNLQFEDTINFCKNNVSQTSTLVMLHDDAEYNYLLTIMNQYRVEKVLNSLIIFLGIVQVPGTQQLISYSGKFIWLREPTIYVTKNSSTYWHPISQWIENFTTLTVPQRSQKTFTMNQLGEQLSGDIFNTGYPINATVMCQDEPLILSPTSATVTTTTSAAVTTTTSAAVAAAQARLTSYKTFSSVKTTKAILETPPEVIGIITGSIFGGVVLIIIIVVITIFALQ